MNEVTGTITAEAVVLSLSGRIDSGNASHIQEMIQGLLPKPLDKPVVLDMKELEYISSAGLRVLLSAQKIMNKQGTMKIIHVSDAINEIFEVTGFSEILNIEEAWQQSLE